LKVPVFIISYCNLRETEREDPARHLV